MCLSGGSFLNVLGNSVLKVRTVQCIHVPPCLMMLVFTLVQHVLVSSRRMNPLNRDIALLGKEYTEEEIESVLKGLKSAMKV